jgi:pimeloyl-ACP methyl ester carboxylesterase
MSDSPIALASAELGYGRVSYRCAGEGPPVLLLHGGWSDSREWEPVMQRLAGEYRVVAWDAPGCGGSFDPPDGFPLASYAGVAVDLVRALELERPHVVGLSFGAGVAIALYERDPNLPRSLVLASAYAGWAGSLPPEVVAARVESVLASIRGPADEWIDELVPGFFAGHVPDEVLGALRAIMTSARPAGIGGCPGRC